MTNSGVAVTGVAFAAMAFVDPTATSGWLYNPSTGEFAAYGFNETTNKWFNEP